MAAYNQLSDLEKARKQDSQLVTYILAGKDYCEGNYTSAITQYEELEGYKDSDKLILQCKYDNLVENIDQMDNLNEAQKQLKQLKDGGIEDSENLEYKIEYQIRSNQFNLKYKKANYSECSKVLKSWRLNYPDMAHDFTNQNKDIWYNDLLKYIDNMTIAYNTIYDVECLIECIGIDYKDVNDIYQIQNEYLRSFSGPKYDIDKLCSFAKKYDLATRILLVNWKDWMIGTWKTSDGQYYFTITATKAENGWQYHYNTSYNLPGYDSSNTYFEIDDTGYYIYDQADVTESRSTRKDMFNFEIIDRDQIKVYSYKDNSNHILYRQ